MMVMTDTRKKTSGIPPVVRQQDVASKLAAVRRRVLRHGVMMIIIVTAAALLYVAVRIDVIRLGYEVTALQSQADKLLEKKSRLQTEIETMKSPSYLEQRAAAFSMRAPAGDQIVIVNRKDYENPN